jgi:hypothetical protein
VPSDPVQTSIQEIFNKLVTLHILETLDICTYTHTYRCVCVCVCVCVQALLLCNLIDFFSASKMYVIMGSRIVFSVMY